MREYRHELEDYDEYEDEGEEQEYEEEEEEEYEEEEDPKPTKEELEYLELRSRLKEAIRKQMKKENGSSLGNRQEAKIKPPNDNFGSFFGPAKPVIAQRVIQESKSLLENQHLAAKHPNSQHVNKKSSTSATAGPKAGVHKPAPRVTNEMRLKVKAQKLKDTRDYSFLLSDNAEPPAPAKESSARSWPTSRSESQSTQVPSKSRPTSGDGRRHSNGDYEQRKPMNGHVHPKVGSSKLTSASKPNSASSDPRKQLGSRNGIGPGRPSGPKAMPSKMPVAGLENRASAPGSKSSLPALHRQPSSKLQSSVPKQPQHQEQRKQQQHLEQRKPPQHLEQRKQPQHLEQRRQPQHQEQRRQPQHLEQRRQPQQLEQRRQPQHLEQRRQPQHPEQRKQPQHLEQRKQPQHLEQRKERQDLNRTKVMPKQPVASSRPQIKKPLKPNPSRPIQDQRPKKKPLKRFFDDDDDEGGDAIAMIRNMFRYNPNKFAGRDEDDSDMEANFDDILKEEKRSAKIARKEDEEQARLIEQEEEEERRQRALRKKRKLGQR